MPVKQNTEELINLRHKMQYKLFAPNVMTYLMWAALFNGAQRTSILVMSATGDSVNGEFLENI